MNVARLNFSHNTHKDHQRRIDLVKKVRSELKMPIAIMLDTKGPEYRIKTFKNQKITLNDGDKFIFTTNEVEGDETKVSVSFKNLPSKLTVGDTILLNNGLLTFEVEKIDGADIKCTVVIGGELSDRKSMSSPGKVMKQEYLSEQDKKDIAFGVQNNVDYIACSFVSNKQDLIDVHNYLKELNADDIELIAKIENQSGFDNIEEILEAQSWTNIVQVSAGRLHAIGLKSDGTVVTCGRPLFEEEGDKGKFNVADWKDIVYVSADNQTTVGLKSDGTVIVTGYNNKRYTKDWIDVITVCQGGNYIAAIKNDGTLLKMGMDELNIFN